MTIEIKEGRYISHFWFVDDGGTKDWMACLWRDLAPGSKWHMTYRFRYYQDDKALDSADEKSWMEMEGPAEKSETKVVQMADEIARMTELHFRGKSYKLVVQSSDVPAIIQLLKSQVWMHIREDKLS
jgi:hypothetical protein